MYHQICSFSGFSESILFQFSLTKSFLFFISFMKKEIATLTHKFSSVTLYKNKTIRYAARLHAIIACQMEFQLYPMDIQICPIYIESFSYSNSKVRLKWAESGVNINPELKLLQYNLGAPLQLEETDGYMPEKDGNYSRLTVYFRFERQIGEASTNLFENNQVKFILCSQVIISFKLSLHHHLLLC